ncbi:MAG: sulfate adenylyltransferase subunit CysN, partial [Pseudomonadota bacterium]|nr:sulfate adenylyltransferase subunit CysN [Pseudomonadota bacterium]
GAFIVIDRLTNITVGAGMVQTTLKELEGGEASMPAEISEFELELNALVRKHFPHWGAVDISKLKK